MSAAPAAAEQINQPLAAPLPGGTSADDFLVGGSSSNDTVFGLEGDDQISSGSGADIIDGGRGDDTLVGGSGQDQLYGSVGDDVVSGSSGADFVSGADGYDQLSGGAGRDTISGGGQRDILHGGSGVDIFVYEALRDSRQSSGIDYIDDFQLGKDFLDLSAIDADTTQDGIQHFTRVPSYSGTPGELRIDHQPSFIRIHMDVNGNGKDDMVITVYYDSLTTWDSVTVDDFVI